MGFSFFLQQRNGGLNDAGTQTANRMSLLATIHHVFGHWYEYFFRCASNRTRENEINVA